MDLYLWLKALHIIAIITWMAGLFYLPRLYVYHSQATVGSELSETFKIMERRLLRAIMNPAMIVSIALGFWLATEIGAWSEGWLHAKLTLVTILVIFHHALGRYRKAFLEDRNVKSEKFYRMINEVPTLVLIGIVFLVIFKPF